MGKKRGKMGTYRARPGGENGEKAKYICKPWDQLALKPLKTLGKLPRRGQEPPLYPPLSPLRVRTYNNDIKCKTHAALRIINAKKQRTKKSLYINIRIDILEKGSIFIFTEWQSSQAGKNMPLAMENGKWPDDRPSVKRFSLWNWSTR